MEASGVTLAPGVLAFCRREGFSLTGRRVLCAVSGGVDSMVLLHLLWQHSQREEISLTAATFDHRMRPGSAEDADFVARWCRERAIPCVTGAGDVAEYAKDRRLTTEEAARELRYAFLERTAEETGAEYIATAHNADDNAETLLLHLLRGSGLGGLGGIPPRRGRIIRPLLEVSRSRIEDYAAANGVPCREDESNSDTAYTRNYLRHNLLPLLREKNPNLAATMSRTARILRQDEACLAALARQAAQRLVEQRGTAVCVPVRELNALPAAVAMRLVQEMAQQARPGTVLPHVQRQALLELAGQAQPSGSVNLSGGLLGRRSYERLCILPKTEHASGFTPLCLHPGETKALPELGLTFSCRLAPCPQPRREDRFYFAPGGGEIVIRPRTPGEEIYLPGRGHKRMKKWMMEEKIPREERDRLPVIEVGGRAVAVVGMGPRWDGAVLPGETGLELTVERKERERQNEHGS